MDARTNITLTIESDKADLLSFLPFLQQEFFTETQKGNTIEQLLCEQFKVDPDYVENRISTIFLDGHPVDDVKTTSVKTGSTVALSAAMPGLVGATFRKGGLLAGFRSGISYQEDTTLVDTDDKATVGIKLFNMIIKEIGPIFLQSGIWIKKEYVEAFFKDQAQILPAFINGLEKDNVHIDLSELTDSDWSEISALVLFKVIRIEKQMG
jgi:hypothetical protein